MGYITGSHFKPGYGGFKGESEQNRAFKSSKAEENKLGSDRIQFFKDAHFDHADRSKSLFGSTSMKSTFEKKDMSGKAKINDGNIAYNRRHHVHDNGNIGQ